MFCRMSGLGLQAVRSRNPLPLVLVAAGLVAGLTLLWGSEIKQRFFDYLGGVDREYYAKMKSITVGMSEDDIVRILGQPSEVLTEPQVKQWHGDPALYGKAIANRNKVLVYHHGADVSGHYFLDEDGKVFLVNAGGT